MFRPMIYAPMPSPKRLAKSLSGPVVPPVLPFISRNARVPMYQPCSSSPPTPSGSFSPWRGPAPYPSSEIAKLWTRSLDMESFSGFHMPRMGRPEIDRRTIGLLLDPSLLLLLQQHPRRAKPVAQHREPIREKRLLHFHEDLATLAQQRVEPLRLLRAVHPQRQIRAAHRLSPRDVRPHEDRVPNLDARVQDRVLPVGWNAGLIRLVRVRAHHGDLAAEVLLVEPKCGCARAGIIDVDVELHVAAPDCQLRVALVLHPNDEQSGAKSTDQELATAGSFRGAKNSISAGACAFAFTACVWPGNER